MSLVFDPISSPGATRDLYVDLTGALEADEALTSATVVSGHPATLAISNVAVNQEPVELDGHQVEAGKGVHFTIATLLESQANVPLVVNFEGDSGTSDAYELSQPLVVQLCR